MSNMQYTVAELIKQLQELPQNLPVLVSDYETGYEHFIPPRIEKVAHEPSNEYYDGEFQQKVNTAKNIVDVVVIERVLRND